MIAVGIDISKAKSTVAVIDSDGTVLASPFTMAHTQPEMEAFVSYLKGLGEPTTILMEYTGHYHYPVLKKLQDEGFPVCIVNPYQMKKYGDVEIHKAKTDKKDALRIAAYALEKSYKLVPYSSMEQKYEDLKFLSRQYNQRISYVAKLKVQLIALLDQTMPGITRILPLNSRNPENARCCSLSNDSSPLMRFKELERRASWHPMMSWRKRLRNAARPARDLVSTNSLLTALPPAAKTLTFGSHKINVLTCFPQHKMLPTKSFLR